MVLVAGNVAPLLLYIWTSSSKSKCVYIGSHIAILAPEIQSNPYWCFVRAS